jgi:hypothetical protein
MARRITRQARCPTDGQYITTIVLTAEQRYHTDVDNLDGHYCEDVAIYRRPDGTFCSIRQGRRPCT